MRFTKIPLIATLMAVALSLLIVLPGLAQSTGYDDTRGQLSSGDSLTVAVLSGVPDDTTVDNGVDESISASYFNGNLYVSNDDDALNMVRITATGGTRSQFGGPDGIIADVRRFNTEGNGEMVDPVEESADNVFCAVATVKNNRSGKRISVRLSGGGDNSTPSAPAANFGDPEMVEFAVVANGLEPMDNGTRACGEDNPDDSVSVTTFDAAFNVPTAAYSTGTGPEIQARMPARHGDTLTITVAGVSGSVTIVVDGEAPEFTEISPEHGAKISSQTVKFRFVVSDSDSGLAHDGELDYSRGDNDARAFNTDSDNFTAGEPRSVAGGAARDIKLMMLGSSPNGDQSASGSSGWRQRGGRPGVSYFLDMAVTNVGEGSNPWYLEATDRAGNTERTDSNPGKDDDQDFSLVVDVASPEFRDARTGISYDEDDNEEVVNRSYIAVTFEDVNGLDALSALDHSKFLVEDAEVVGAIHLSDDADCGNDDSKDDNPLDIDGDCIEDEYVPQSRIYLELAEPLAPDATPQVSMFGGAVLDLAGNPSNQDEVIAADNIAPAITVTISTEVTGRPVIRNNGEVTVSITSDEELRRLPTVYFGEVVDGAADDAEEADTELGSIRRGDRVQSGTDDLTWSRTYNNGDVGGSDGLYAVIVVAEDDADNVGTPPGWEQPGRKTKAPVDGDGIDFDDLTDAGLALEIDTDANNDEDPVFSLSPEADEGESESNNPYITIDFSAEAGEYSTSTKRFKSDSHSAVEIASITLNGNDVSDHVAQVENNKYTLAAQDLGTGEYELKVTGRDDVGNEVSDEYEFEVVERGDYKVSLTPGWNLVSLPGTPLDSSTQAVMSGTMQATIVLAYQDDVWLTSVNDNGTWRGTLTDIVGGYGYWVQTTAFESISALIPETDTSSVLPTASVIKGWNLLGVVDVLQAKAGDPPSGGDEADDYFDNIAWKVAYSFDTSSNAWEKSIPGDGDNDNEVVNGKGYWVWSTEAGTLVP